MQTSFMAHYPPPQRYMHKVLNNPPNPNQGSMTMETMNEIGEHDHGSPQGSDPMMTGAHDLSPMSAQQQSAVSVASVLDSNELRSHMPEPTYQTLNGRMSPTLTAYHTGSYTLTSLQPLPPISTVSDKFGQQPAMPVTSGASFALMPNNNFVPMDTNYRYDHKLAFGNTSPINYGNMMMNGYGQPAALGYHTSYSNGLASPKNDPKLMSPNSPYGDYSRMSRNLQSPTPMIANPMNATMHMSQSPVQQAHMAPTNGRADRHMDNKNEPVEEINTKELAQKISSELKRYSIPQAVFAQRVLCRSQGTLSDLLRNPKPWSKLKSGRETFRRMWKWLQEPEFSRMSALRLADPMVPGMSLNNAAVVYNTGQHEPIPAHQNLISHYNPIPQQLPEKSSQMIHLQDPKMKPAGGKRKVDNDMMSHSSDETRSGPKKPRLVFTDIQRRTLHAIFKETKRPSKEMQQTIAQQLGLEVTTVANFFMNARRRSVDKWKDEMDRDSSGGSTTSNKN